MEEILRKIVSECETCKLTQIVSHCHQAIEIIGDRSSLLRYPINEVRDKCAKVFELCLINSNKNSKLISLAINGLQIMIRQQVYWTIDCKEESKQLSSQLIKCISSAIQLHKESTQVDMLSLITEMSASIPSLLTLDNIEDITEMCCKLTPVSTSHQMAIETAVSQSCHQFVKYCISSECLESSENDINSIVDEEIMPLLNLISQKLSTCHKDSVNNASIALLLKCVHFILLTIPNDSPVINENIVGFIWKVLIPILIKLLSTASINHLSSKNHHEVPSHPQLDSKQIGRGSESLSKIDNISNFNKYIYKVSSELLRLFGSISSLRPVLESLFHRILLYPPVDQRSEGLRFIQEILKNCSLLVIASCDPIERFGEVSQSKDLDLLHIILDSLEECSVSSDALISSLSISCIVTFLKSLQSICNGCGLSGETVDRINKLYLSIEDAEFEGFDVRNTKLDYHINGKQAVNFDVLQDRIKGYDADTDIRGKNEQTFVRKKSPPNELNKNIKNFKVEAYKSKLSEILKSRSLDSCSSSQEIDSSTAAEENGETKLDIAELPKNNEINLNESSGEKYISESNEINLTEASAETNSITNYEEFDDNERSVTSGTSSDTEGPEYEDCVEDAQSKTFSIDLFGKQTEVYMQEVYKHSTESAHQERDSARQFIKALKRFLPKLLTYRSSVEADEALQLFASNFCKELWEQQKYSERSQTSDNNRLPSHLTIVNADGIYLSTYSALLLNLKLIQSNFYDNACKVSLPTEQEFIDEIHNSGVLVYISGFWLAELYQRVLSENMLADAGYQCEDQSNVALINLLTDIDGLDSCQPGAQQLSDYRRLERAVSSQHYKKSAETEAGRKLVRRLLTAFWQSMLGSLGSVFRFEHFSTDLISTNTLNILLGSDNNKIATTKREMIATSLDGLQLAAKLCIQLGLQSRCDTVFELLTYSILQMPPNDGQSNRASKKAKQLKRTVLEVIKNRSSFSLHTSQVLSMQVLLTSCLEIGSHCNPCWSYVFKCCQYIIELEHNYFTSRHSSLLTSTRTSISSLIKSNKSNMDFELNLASISEIMNSDNSSMPGMNESEHISIETSFNDLITQTAQTSDSILKDKQLERIIEILSHLVDRLFEEAAQKLNLRSLLSFLSELCLCSRDQLSMFKKTDTNIMAHSGKSLLLYRLSDVILRCAKSGRPLLHFMKCWPVVASHLVETACHSDHSVAKKSIATLHDIINAILSLHNELPHFHFNEALFKPFENLLLLELCDSDVQELIISSICEFVEGTTEEIRSGWRSLFGALRGIHLPSISPSASNASELELERVRQLRVILDIFEAFLHTDNLQVFANAAVDCLLCLMRLIKSSSNDIIINNDDDESEVRTPDLCLVSLKYIHQFSSMLRSMYQMPACPMFSSSRRLQACGDTKLVDSSRLSSAEFAIDLNVEITLDALDRPVKILHVWFLLIDELTLAIESCPNQHKISAMEMLFNMLKALTEIPGPNFTIYCTNHILLPALQRWTRATIIDNNVSTDSSSNIASQSIPSLRLLCGLSADLVVDNIKLLNTDSNGHDLSQSTLIGINLMLQQSLLVFIECLNGSYPESLAKLCCSCIRHILLSSRNHFDNQLWKTTADYLSIAHRLTLTSMQSLIDAFGNKSANFFDDLDQIKVLTKRDPNEDTEQLARLAKQIFLLDAQKCTLPDNKREESGSNLVSIGDDRAFTFLINNSNNSEEVHQLSISYRELIIQLTCHWLLLQTLSSLTLCGINPLMAHLQRYTTECQTLNLSLFINHYRTLLSLFDYSYRISTEFDDRPGLKFLIQKIMNSEVPANLYQVSSLCWSVQFVVNFFISINRELRNDESKDTLRQLLVDLSDKYTECVQLNDNKDTKNIDDICGQSLFFLQASTDELADIIGSDKVVKSRTEEHENAKNNSECDTDIKVYRLATEKKIDSLMTEYKRFKNQYSPKPPDVNDIHSLRKAHLERKVSNSDKQRQSQSERDNEKLIIKDSEAFIALWSEMIASAIELHLGESLDAFNYLVPAFLPSIQALIIYSESRQLRTGLALWLSQIAKNIINNLDQH